MSEKRLRRIALLFILTIYCLTSSAQVGERRNDLAIGINGGVAMNKIFFVPTLDQKFTFGPTAGITMRYTCEKYFSALCALQVELNYAELGWKENITDINNNPLPDTYERRQHYVQFPFLARLAWGREKRGAMGYILLGPQVGWCFKEKEVMSETWTTNSSGEPDRAGNKIEQYGMPIDNRFDYGITGGLGLEINTKVGHFLIEGRYYYGLGDIFSNSKKDVFDRSANGCITAKVSYLIDINKKRKR